MGHRIGPHPAVHLDVETEFDMANGWVIRRFTKSEVSQWGGTVLETPLGYLVEIA